MAKKLKRKLKGKRKYAVGGMYSNTIPTGLMTTNIVAEESNPEVLKQKQQQFGEEQRALTELSSGASDKIKEDKILADQRIEEVAAQSGAQTDAILEGTQQVVGLGQQTGLIGKKGTDVAEEVVDETTGLSSTAAGSSMPMWDTATGSFVKQKIGGAGTSLGGAFKGAASAYKAQRATNQAIKAGTLLQSSAGGAGKAGLSALGQGLGSFAKSGAGIGTIAGLAGAGISKWSSDDDATTMNFGEGAGATLSGIGTGIGAAATTAMIAGSALGPVGTLIGGAAGAIYGLGKGLIQRGKARKEKSRLKNKRDKYIAKTNKTIGNRFGTHMANVRAGALKSKTFSGYDLGYNTTAKYGGLRLGVPRYGN